MKQAADLKLRRARAYQLLRRGCLTLSCAFFVLIPLWHLRSLHARTPPLIGAPWTVDLFGLEILDPLAAVCLLAARAFDGHTVLIALLALALTIVFGRFFCGFLCPYIPLIAASNAARALLTKLGLSPVDLPLHRRTRFVVLGLVLAGSVAGFHFAPLFYPPALIERELFRVIFFGAIGTGALVIAFAFLFDTLVARAGFCRHLCPGGAVFSLIGALSPVRIQRKPEACTDCTLCDVVCNLGQGPMTDRVDAGCERCAKCVSVCPTDALKIGFARPAPLVQLRLPERLPPEKSPPERRRLFLSFASLAGLGAVLGVSRRARSSENRLRPPAAAPGHAFTDKCIRCVRCAEVCPPKAIRFDSLLDLRGSDTPFIDAQKSACVLCMKCTEVCPTGALKPTSADLKVIATSVKMGTPILDHARCIAWNRSGVCRICYYVCPYADRAIRLVGPNQAPAFDASFCVGCGLCEQACPSRAHAIRIFPTDGGNG